MDSRVKTARVAFQGEPGAFSEAAAIQLLGDWIDTVPCPTFDAAFRSIKQGAADALLVPVENSLAGSVVRVYDLLLGSELGIVAETILPIEHHLIGCPGASLVDVRAVSSHPMALAQCERFFATRPHLLRIAAEDTAGSVREVLTRGDKTAAAIAGRRAAERYRGAILAENIQDNEENFTRFVLLVPVQRESDGACNPANSAILASPAVADLMAQLRARQMDQGASPTMLKVSFAMRLAHTPGSLLASLEPLARDKINLLKIESRPLHGSPWEYQFFIDVETDSPAKLETAFAGVRKATSDFRILGFYPVAKLDQRKSS